MKPIDEDTEAFAASLVDGRMTESEHEQFRAGWVFGRAAGRHTDKHEADPSGGSDAGWFWRQGFDAGHLRR